MELGGAEDWLYSEVWRQLSETQRKKWSSEALKKKKEVNEKLMKVATEVATMFYEDDEENNDNKENHEYNIKNISRRKK